MRIDCIPTILSIVLGVVAASGETSVRGGHTHGTINILLANANGMVLVTDSRTSNELGARVSDESPKLFALDDQTACSFAGFYFDPGPHGEFPLQMPGILTSFRYELAQRSARMTFDQKVKLLAAHTSLLLSEHARANNFASDRRSLSRVSMLVAGYDLDGSGQIAKVELSSAGEISSITVKAVGSTLLFLTAGIDDGVQARLLDPALFPGEMQLQAYRDSLRAPDKNPLILSQMQALAGYLESNAAEYREVGGPIQMATLATQHVELSLPPGLEQARDIEHIIVMVGLGFSHSFGVLADTSHQRIAYVNFTCENAGIVLDNAVLIAGSYEDCKFYLDGGWFYRDKNVKVVSGNLVVGPDTSENSEMVSRAQRELPEVTKLSSYKELPITVQQILWPDFFSRRRRMVPR